MKTDIIISTGAASSRDFDLGTWLGRRQAFSMMAGKASAADIECLRTIREQRLYKSKKEKWEDFCAEHIGASRTQVDRQIRYLEEFGPSFFELTHVTRITPETYRLIAKNVSAEGLSFDDQNIPMTQENSHRISAAVAELRKRVEPSKVPIRRLGLSSRSGDLLGVALLEIRLEDVIDSLQEVSSLDTEQRADVSELFAIVRKNAARLGVV